VEISWLQTFVTAAKYGNFHKASEILHLAQPTVTVQIQKLEALWEVSLFERVGRSVQLSSAGKRFFHHAEAILARYEESIQDMARWREGYQDIIAISVSPIIATTFLPKWVQSFRLLHPNITFTVHIADSAQIAEEVSALEADIGFSRLMVTSQGIFSKPIYDDPLVLVMPIEADNEGGGNLYIEDVFRRYTLFTHNHPGCWNEILFGLQEHFSTIRTMQVTQAYVCLDWILEGMGISFLPTSIVRRAVSIGAVELIPFNLFEIPMTRTYVVSRQKQRDIVSEFASFVVNYMVVRPLSK
jgi:LysR family transcriptional regulator, repressor for citA